MFRHTEFATNFAHFVFEQPFQRLAELEFHFFGQSADIVVALDGLASDIETLDAVGIDCALTKPFGICNLLSLSVEDIHKTFADDFAFLLRLFHASEFDIEFFFGVNTYHIETEALVIVKDVLELVFAEETVVNENTSQILANRLVEKHRRNARIHATAQSKHHLVVADLRLQFGYRGVDERCRRPILFAAADAHHKILQEQCALQRVEHFGVELHAPNLLVFGGVGSVFYGFGGCNALKIVGNCRNGVAVAHPHLRIVVKSLKQRIFLVDELQILTAIFAAAGGLHVAAQCVRNELRTIANAQNRFASTELLQIDLERLLVIDAVRRAAEDDADDVVVVAHGVFVVGDNFTKSVEFADAPRNELRGLRTKIQN